MGARRGSDRGRARSSCSHSGREAGAALGEMREGASVAGGLLSTGVSIPVVQLLRLSCTGGACCRPGSDERSVVSY